MDTENLPPDAATQTTIPLPVLGEIGSFWSPKRTQATCHSGAPLPEDLVYVAPPPTDDIGEVVTAYSTVHQGKGGIRDYRDRINLTIAIVALSMVLLVFLIPLPFAVPIIVTLLILSLTVIWVFMLPENSTTYVGKVGVAKFVLSRDGRRVKASRVVRFADVADMFVALQGADRGVKTLVFFALGSGGRIPVFVVHAESVRGSADQNRVEARAFVASVGAAFVAYHLPKCQMRLKDGESIPFYFGRKKEIIVSAAGIDIRRGHRYEFISLPEIAEISVVAGTLTIARKGFSRGVLGIGGHGVYSFGESDIANQPLLLALLEYLVRQSSQAAITRANSHLNDLPPNRIV